MENQSRRGNRANRERQSGKQKLNVPLTINTFKDFLNSRLNFDFPEGYSTMYLQKKQQIWKGQLQKLITQRVKICFYLPDKMTNEEVQFGIQMMKKYDLENLLDYEYESMFLGNKKQLLIYLKCQEMEKFLQKYKLNKQYQTQMKEVEKQSAQLRDKQIQRNIYISTFQTQEVKKINQEIQVLNQKFDKAFQQFSLLMGEIFQHFKSQKNRKTILLSAVRNPIFEKLKQLGPKYEVQITNRFADIEYDEILDVQVIKKSQRQNIYIPSSERLNKQSGEQTDSDKSSFVSSLSDEEQQDRKIECLPPIGIRSVYFQKYQNKIVELKVILESVQKQSQTPLQLHYSYNTQHFFSKQLIQNSKQIISVLIPIKENGYLDCNFKTYNETGFSNLKNFNYYLKINSDLQLVKNGNLIMIGQSEAHIPKDKVKKEKDMNVIGLASSDFSISSTQTIVCDKDGNAADWGLMKVQEQGQPEIIQKSQYFNIVNKSKKMQYHQPAIRLEKNHQIRKVSCGRGYAMMLDCYGSIWVYGKNEYGQLGMKNQLDFQQAIKIDFFEKNKIFIVDIKATQSGASFCIDSKGQLYKWGVNQLLFTNEPIYDRFGSVINYALSNCINEQWNPLPVKKHFQKERIIHIQCGNQFYLVLNNQNTLYGWGQCRNLGKGILQDGKENQIQNICNEIELMRDVSKFSAGNDHAIAIKTDGKVIGWGNMNFLSNQQTGFKNEQVDLTTQYGHIEAQDLVKCGPNYTCIFKKNQKKLRIYASESKFTHKIYDLNNRLVKKIECTNNLIGMLSIL